MPSQPHDHATDRPADASTGRASSAPSSRDLAAALDHVSDTSEVERVVAADDVVIAPAPPQQLIPPRAARVAPQPPARERSLFLRRTMIPILLTLGVILPALAIMWFASDPDSIVRTTGVWLPVALLVLGAILLLLAIVNVAQVKHLLRADERGGGGS